MSTKLKIDGMTFHFEFRKSCEKIGKEILKAIKKYRNSVKYAFITAFDSSPKEFTVIVKRSSKLYDGWVRAFCRTIVLNAAQFEALRDSMEKWAEKNGLSKHELLENVYYRWMFTFLHELAHWLTQDEEEADWLANEWLLSSA